MKFNWRANWEILLVLVIIVVGIVITTIAAIRNKDKHLLVLPEETDFGQFITGGSGHGGLSETTASAPQQIDLHSPVLSNSEDDHHSTRRPPQLQSMIKSSRPPTFHPVVREHQHQQNNNSNHRNQHSNANTHHEGHQSLSSSKYDDSAEYSRPTGGINDGVALDQHQITSGAINARGGQDSYDTMTTEPTPSHIRAEGSGQNHHAGGGGGGGPHYSGNRRHINNRTQTNNNVDAPVYHHGDQLGDQQSIDLIDDIHTTRSSLAGAGNTDASNAYTGNNPSAAIPSPQVDNNQILPITPSLSLQAPYGVTAPSMNQLGQFLMQNTNNKVVEPSPPSSISDSDDMMTSYSRIPTNNSISDALLRDYNLSSAINNVNSNSSQPQQSSQLINSAMLANLLGSMHHQTNGGSVQAASDPFTPSTNHRAYSASLPISVLLNDILKLTTRPQQLVNNQQSPSEEPTSGSNNHQRPQQSILQQLRSLPGPLLALLQGVSPTANTNNAHELGNSLANHDASESSQHYHRISMSPTDIHSILARSLSSSSVLPAFPPPKGAPQTWIPPTSGGNPGYHTMHNSNADFVASNTAGFVRSAQRLDAQQANEQNSYQQYPQQQHNIYQRPTMNSEAFYSQADNGQQAPISGAQQQQYQQPYVNLDQVSIDPQQQQQSQQQQQPQQPVYSPNSMSANGVQADRNWFQTNGGGSVFTGGRGQNGGANNEISLSMLDNPRRVVFKSTNMQVSQQGGGGQQDYNAFLNYPPQNIGAQVNQANPSQPFNMAVNQSPAQSSSSFNHAPVYNSRLPPSEMPVPLGYSPPQVSPSSHQSQNQVQPARAPPFDFNATPVESSPKASITNSRIVSGNNNNKQPQQNTLSIGNSNGQQTLRQQQLQQQQVSGGHQANNQQIVQRKSLRRRRRATGGQTRATEEDGATGRSDEHLMSSKYGVNDDDEEEDGDSRPISVVRPDGRPTNSGRIRGFPAVIRDPEKNQSSQFSDSDEHESMMNDRQVAQSQRNANHLELKQELAPNPYMSLYGKQNVAFLDARTHGKHLRHRSKIALGEPVSMLAPIGSHRGRHHKYSKRTFSGAGKNNNNNKDAIIDTAGSGLMSRLLGTASTNDELEEETDDDDDPVSEKRKEELEDAEFGIVNDERQKQVDSGNSDGSRNANGLVEGGNGGGADSSLGSGSTDSESYTRRNQQRSDIEFYGHPGEETRQLKYGILGSGNYEVVNGGIYPEADESTAAVNSVANYVRKPGSLLTGLPKLLGDHSHEQVGPQAAFMPGGRMGGFLHGASANPDELIGMIPGEIGRELPNPLMDLISANGGHLFDPNMLANLGSSGSSARSTHFSQEQSEKSLNYAGKQRDRHGENSHKRIKNKSKSDAKQQQQQNELEPSSDQDDGRSSMKSNRTASNGHRDSQQQQSFISGSRTQGTNQFNSYQILPSKKVTIFSDQDLDSAPSEYLLTARKVNWSSGAQQQGILLS